MKSFKQLALAAAVLAAPFMAQADLKAMDDSALSGVTGQDGISISGSFNGSIGSIVYSDSETVGSTTTTGSLRLETVSFTGFDILDSDPLKIDVIDGGASGDKLQISLPSITGQLEVGAIRVGDASAASIGSLAVNNMNMSGSTIKVWGH
ncbi:hypothetical protein E8F20_21075 [Pseudomonas sp. BN415]|jgi:hypothetical protein|uniref:DUF6160 family protein n=1 Tax=unclassified Pseudomonas TaxID=196821 RepID=UPI002453BD42|nr:DUF6160 family protein [Pseudomonas sp. BN415]MDH4584355.1 hypothetical protein [Pseudomonas sp. BN415]